MKKDKIQLELSDMELTSVDSDTITLDRFYDFITPIELTQLRQFLGKKVKIILISE